MLELCNFDPAVTAFDAGPYKGQERRQGVDPWMAAALDEIDYGILLLEADLKAVHVNHAARAELDGDHPLQLCGGQLRARHRQDRAALGAALSAATTRGLRKQWVLGDEHRRVSVSVVPLRTPGLGKSMVLVMLGKRRACDALSALSFATSHQLSATESQVLAALCRGKSPADIATDSGVAISTIRTQIGSIRVKTGTKSIRALLEQVATLPPLMSILSRRP